MRTMKVLLGLCALLLGTAALTAQAAGKPVDSDKDGYKSNVDCNDNDPSVWVLNSCGECAVEPSGGCGGPTCTDSDGDTYALEGGECGPLDCNDGIKSIFPGATEICGDGIDQDCSGADLSCGGGTNPHANLTWSDYPTACMNCHNGGEHGDQYNEVFNSTHYQWMGAAPDMVNQPESQQGKLTNEAMFNVFPFENSITVMYLSGTEIQETLDFVARKSSERGWRTQAQVAGVWFDMVCRSTTCPDRDPTDDITPTACAWRTLRRR